MKIIYKTLIGLGYVSKESNNKYTVEFLHGNYIFDFPKKIVEPLLVHNTLYEAILRRKGEWK